MRDNNNKKRLILPIFLGFILIASTFGAIFYGFNNGQQGSQNVRYGDYVFVPGNGMWSLKIGNNELIFAYNPLQVESIEITPFPIEQFNSASKIYATYNPSGNLSTSIAELSGNMIATFTLPTFRACTIDVPGCENYPIKTCNDAAMTEKVLLIEEAETFSTDYKDNCYSIKGSDDEIAMAIDKITYQNVGIMLN